MGMFADLHAFLKTCPFLEVAEGAGLPRVYVDYASENAVCYTINTVPTAPWYRRYVDGGGIKQLTFVFRSIAIYGNNDVKHNIENVEFFERFSEWLTKDAKMPRSNWIKVEPLTEGYIFDIQDGQDKASYQIQCRVLYSV